MTDKPFLKICGLGRRKPGTDDWLLREVCINVRQRDRVALTGPSGSGKTVLLRAIAMLDPHDEGFIEWQGQRVHGDAIPNFRKQVLYLHQRPVLFEGTVDENLRRPFALRAHAAKRFDEPRVLNLLAALKRDESFLEKRSGDLSGGESQIVALVRCLQLDPAVLLLDEPTASLDRTTAEAVEALIDQWQSEATGDRGFLWVSHDHDQARRMSQRTIEIHQGRIQAGA